MVHDPLRDSRELIAKVDVPDRRYAKLGLSKNPFFASGLAPSNPQFEPWLEVREQIIRFLQQFLQNKFSAGLVLLGGYGTGKTYHLNYIRAILQESPHNIRIVSITDPGIHPYHLIRRILLEIGEEEVATMIWAIIGPVLRQQHKNDPNYFERFTKEGGSSRQARREALYIGRTFFQDIDDVAWSDHRLFFEAVDRNQILDRQKLLSNAVSILTNRNADTFVTEIAQIAEDLAAICLYDGVPALERWKALTEGVGKGAIKPGNEPQFLTALLELLKRSGVEYFVLLLDEFEKVPQLQRMTERDARNYLDTLRMLIDEGHEHLPFAYILGSIEEAWLLTKEKMASLEDRFDVIRLPRMFDDEIAKYTIIQFLKSVRLDRNTPPDSITPFPEEFLSHIPASTRRTTRQLVRLCYQVIELAVERNVESVTSELLTEVLGTSDLDQLDEEED